MKTEPKSERELQRWTPERRPFRMSGAMVKSPVGQFVLYADIEPLIRERDELKKGIQNLQFSVRRADELYAEWEANRNERDALREALLWLYDEPPGPGEGEVSTYGDAKARNEWVRRMPTHFTKTIEAAKEARKR